MEVSQTSAGTWKQTFWLRPPEAQDQSSDDHTANSHMKKFLWLSQRAAHPNKPVLRADDLLTMRTACTVIGKSGSSSDSWHELTFLYLPLMIINIKKNQIPVGHLKELMRSQTDCNGTLCKENLPLLIVNANSVVLVPCYAKKPLPTQDWKSVCACLRILG